MKIVFHRKFEKNFKKFTPQLKKKVIAVIDRFAKSPFHKSLNNHSFKGKLYGQRAISVTDNIRIVFEEHDDYMLVLMINVGTHNQAY